MSDFLTRLGWVETLDQGPIEVDFQDVGFYQPAALSALLAAVNSWCRRNRTVAFINAQACPAFRYLQRMDFFTLSGIALPEDFKRHEETGRFMALRRVDTALAGRVDAVCREIATCLFPKLAESDDPNRTGAFDVLEYASSELINNIIQHARGVGYVAVQRYPQKGLVCVGIADSGIGIRRSFEETAPSFWDPAMTHLDAVRTATQPRASSKAHLAAGWDGGRVNEGVGLSMLKEIAADADGVFTLASGTGFYQENHLQKRPYPIEITMLHPFQGTVCSLVLPKEKLGNLQEILLNAKKRLGLLRGDTPFDNLFT